MKLLVFLFTGCMLVAVNTQASFYVEPGLLYNINKKFERNKIPTGYEDAFSGSVNGFDLSVRGGYNINDMWFAGLDLRYSNAAMVPNEGANLNGSSNGLGLNVGLNIPQVTGLKSWFGYYFQGSGKYGEDLTETKFVSMSGMDLGFAYNVHQYVNVVFELWLAGRAIDSNDYTFKYVSGMNLGVSVPISF